MDALRTRSCGPPVTPRLAGAAVGLTLLCALAVPALGQPAFVARVDRAQVALGESFRYEVSLSVEAGRADGYRAPDFKGFRVLAERPSQSTQIQMGGGGTFTRTIYGWRYDLEPLQPGTLTIGSARVRADGRELKTEPVTVTVGAASGGGRAAPNPAPAPSPRPRRWPGLGLGSPLDDLFADDDPTPAPASPPASGSFVRAVPSKTQVFVGEPVVVEWLLCLVERQDKYQTLTEPRTDGFWMEELPVPTAQGSLALTPQNHGGRVYLVAPLMRKALFPLHEGKLTVTPMESEISQVDFFGRVLRTERLRAEPLVIEAVPLPTAGRPAGFDPANVGRFTLSAQVDRDRVNVGEAVTLTLAVSGEGNLRKLEPPKLPALPGWKSYQPKVDVKLDKANGVTGTKTLEYLLLPERAGATVIPSIELAFFDPAARAYMTESSAPLQIEVTHDGSAGGASQAANAPPGSAVAMAGVENVLPAEIRPPRTRPSLRRDLGTTFYRSRGFLLVLLAPPVAFGFTVVASRMREKLGQDTRRRRRRETRRLVRQSLRAAEAHLEAGLALPFFIEIDRVLREVLTSRLGRKVTGLSREELRPLLGRSGLGEPVAERIIAELEECDRARFAPGSVDTADMRASLERAAELIFYVEKAPVETEEFAS
jgi:hypothetical protein